MYQLTGAAFLNNFLTPEITFFNPWQILLCSYLIIYSFHNNLNIRYIYYNNNKSCAVLVQYIVYVISVQCLSFRNKVWLFCT